MRKSYLAALSLTLILAGCSLRPELPDQKQSFTPSQNSSIQISAQWWKEFNDPILDELVTKALNNNLNLKIAYINMQKAARALGVSKADWLPGLNLSAGATRSGSTGEPNNSFNLRAGLSYELDIWGKVRDSVDAANANFKASSFDFDAARLSLVASVVKGYFNLASLMEQRDIYKQSLQNYETTRNQYADKLVSGTISKSEYLQSVASVKSAKIGLASINASISSAKAALSILTGASIDEIIYGDINVGESTNLILDFGGIDSQILEHRPDIAAAWQRVVAANAQIGIAKKAWLPSISLSAGFGYTSNKFDELINTSNSLWSLGGSLTQMIFDAGRINANIDIAKLSQDSAFINYESVVRTAFSEVITALNEANSALISYYENKGLLDTQVKIYEISRVKFEYGESEYITLLDAQRNLLNTKLALAKANFNQKNAVVDVFKALGGGWSKEQSQEN